MSAARAYAKPKVRLPSLPPELWIHIFRIATCLPSCFASQVEAFGTGILFRAQRKRYIKQVQLTRRVICRVSKLWNTMATPLLYECIIISRVQALRFLADTLTRSKCNAGLSSDGIALGSLAREFFIEDMDLTQDDCFDVFTGPLMQTIQHLPYLATFIASFKRSLSEPYELPVMTLELLGKTCGPCLRTISISGNAFFYIGDGIKRLLTSSPNVQSLYCDIRPCVSADMSQFSFQSLKTLDVTCLLKAAALPEPNSFPALREIIVREYWTARSAEPWWHFLQHFGHNLTRMVIQDVEELSATIGRIHEFCPNLCRIDLSVDYWSIFDHDTLTWPRITHLGLRSWLLQAPTWEYSLLLHGFQNMNFPCLKVVQFLDNRCLQDFRFRHPRVFRQLTEFLGGKCVEINDSDGTVIEAQGTSD